MNKSSYKIYMYISDMIPCSMITTHKLIKNKYNVKQCEDNKNDSKTLFPILFLQS